MAHDGANGMSKALQHLSQLIVVDYFFTGHQRRFTGTGAEV